jgi:hypothetical protein
VFALWVARAGVELAPWAPVFARSRALGAARMEALAEEAASTWGVAPAATRRYLFEECLFEPGERLAPALLAFRDAAAELGLARADLDPVGVPAQPGTPGSSPALPLLPSPGERKEQRSRAGLEPGVPG